MIFFSPYSRAAVTSDDGEGENESRSYNLMLITVRKIHTFFPGKVAHCE